MMYLEIGDVDQLSVLVLGQDCDEGGPATAQVFLTVHQLTLTGVQVRVWL